MLADETEANEKILWVGRGDVRRERHRLYAAGEHGTLLERRDGRWRAIATHSNADLRWFDGRLAVGLGGAVIDSRPPRSACATTSVLSSLPRTAATTSVLSDLPRLRDHGSSNARSVATSHAVLGRASAHARTTANTATP